MGTTSNILRGVGATGFRKSAPTAAGPASRSRSIHRRQNCGGWTCFDPCGQLVGFLQRPWFLLSTRRSYRRASQSLPSMFGGGCPRPGNSRWKRKTVFVIRGLSGKGRRQELGFEDKRPCNAINELRDCFRHSSGGKTVLETRSATVSSVSGAEGLRHRRMKRRRARFRHQGAPPGGVPDQKGSCQAAWNKKACECGP